MSDNFFNFEREGLDFPFYKGNPKLTKSGWIFLLISVLLLIFHSFVYCTVIYNYLYLPPLVEHICFLDFTSINCVRCLQISFIFPF